MAKNRALKVFLSYAATDRNVVNGLYRRLTQDGVDVWVDFKDLIPGMAWTNAISEAIDNADVVIACLSKSSVSRQGFVQKEFKYALERAMTLPENTIYLIPLRLEECEVPYTFSHLQWVDLFNKNGYENLLRSLRARSASLGLSAEKIQVEKTYWDTVLDSIEGVHGLYGIAQASDKLPLSSTDDEDFSNFVISTGTISQYVQAAMSSETTFNRQEQLEKANNATKDLLVYFETVPNWRFPAKLPGLLNVWKNTLEVELKKYQPKEPIPNVYIAGSPLAEKSKVFKGRRDIFRAIERELATEAEQRPTLLLFGARRTGKTSVLRQLPIALGPQVIPVTVDLQIMALTNNLTTFLEKLADEIRKSALASRKLRLPELSRETLLEDPYTVFVDWIKLVDDSIQEKWILVCLDEYEYFEKMLIDGRVDERVFQLLRSIVQNIPHVTLLFSGTHTLEEMSPLWSHYLINVRTIKIGQLEEKDARELIEKPIEDFPLSYSDAAVKRILMAVGGQPYLLQAVCRDLVNLLNDEGIFYATDSHVEKALDSVMTTGSAYFKELWSGPDRNEKQRKIMLELAKKKGKFVSENVVRKIGEVSDIRLLLNHDLIEKNNDGYKFRVDLVRRWVSQQV